jgi:hypothetical protein
MTTLSALAYAIYQAVWILGPLVYFLNSIIGVKWALIERVAQRRLLGVDARSLSGNVFQLKLIFSLPRRQLIFHLHCRRETPTDEEQNVIEVLPSEWRAGGLVL